MALGKQNPERQMELGVATPKLPVPL